MWRPHRSKAIRTGYVAESAAQPAHGAAWALVSVDQIVSLVETRQMFLGWSDNVPRDLSRPIWIRQDPIRDPPASTLGVAAMHVGVPRLAQCLHSVTYAPRENVAAGPTFHGLTGERRH